MSLRHSNLKFPIAGKPALNLLNIAYVTGQHRMHGWPDSFNHRLLRIPGGDTQSAGFDCRSSAPRRLLQPLPALAPNQFRSVNAF